LDPGTGQGSVDGSEDEGVIALKGELRGDRDSVLDGFERTVQRRGAGHQTHSCA
jgi:hypothetical protein